MKKTPWFYAAKYKPVRIGEYECSRCGIKHYWDGKKWKAGIYDKRVVNMGIAWWWRGLTRRTK